MILQLLVNDRFNKTNINVNLKGDFKFNAISASKIKYNCILKAGGIYSQSNPITS
ncbi:hypothetical protein ACER0A_005525 [Haloimpatiens sp. FM7315]|uniref:hypothetical protein n=1 Tax=Haloimpatiens sp. FM7315 TaxID=3298609 RepID=UPI0035A2C95B